MFFIPTVMYSIISYWYFYKMTKDSINPFGISILIYMIMYGLCTLNLSIYQTQLLLGTHVMCWIPALIIFIIGYYYAYNYRSVFCEEILPIVTPNYRRIMWFVSVLSLVAIAYLIFTREIDLKVDISQAGALNARKEEVTERIFAGAGIIGKLAQLYPFTMIFIAYDLIFNDRMTLLARNIEIVYCVLCAIYTLFVLASRGTFLLPVIAILYLLNKRYHFKARTIAIILLTVVFLFTLYMGIRVVKESAVFSGAFTANRTFNSVYNYFALSFNNFDQLVRRGSPFTIVSFSHISLSKLLGIYDESKFILAHTDFFNSRTFLYGFYHDLGLGGIILYTTLIFVIIGKVYILSKKKKPYLILLLSMFGKALFVMSFGNYFFGSISQDIQVYACLIVLIYGYRFKQISFKVKLLPHYRIKLH